MPDRVVLPEISSRAWEHPADRAALQSLRRVPGFDLLLRKVFGLFSERAIRLITQGSAVLVSDRQYPRVNRLYEEVLKVLDAPTRWDLYVTQTPVVNAGAVGMDKPFILLNSGTVQLLDDDQLRVVLAHEVGHILSDHVLYKTMLRLMLRVSLYAFSLPLTGIAYLAVLAALLEWDRKSELSADRCALLVAQDPDQVRHSLLRLAGGVSEGASIEAFQEQAKAYHESGSALDSVIKTLALLGRSHPFPVHRIAEIDTWVASGAYARVLEGEYPKRQDDPKTSAWDAWKESVESYTESGPGESVASFIKGVGGRARFWKRKNTDNAPDDQSGGPSDEE